MAYDIIVAAGQSNILAGYRRPDIYFDSVTDIAVGPHLYQYKFNRTIDANAAVLDFQSLTGNYWSSWAFYFARDYYIPQLLAPGRDVLIIPAAVGGSGFNGPWEVGGSTYEAMVSWINDALALDAGNVVKVLLWQHGEQDVSDFGAGLGKYATMSMADGYNAYMSEMRADLHSRITGGFDQVPILVGGMIPDICWGPSADVSAFSPNYPSGIGLSADGQDHHNSANATMFGIQKNMPNVLSNCAFVDTLNPTKCMAHDSQAHFNNNVTYWFHYTQAAHREIARRAFKQYRRIAGLGTPVSLSWG